MPPTRSTAQQLDLTQLIAVTSAASFRVFVERFFPIVSSDKFKGSYFVDAVCEHLQSVKDGSIKRLALACPIRQGKSLIASVLFPAWLWIHDPSLRILSVSNGERLAHRDSLRTRQLIDSPLYQQCFGKQFKLADEQNAKSYFANDKKGFRVALGVGSNTAGQDADIILADDILDYDRAKSQAERQNVIDYWEGTLSQRLAMGNGNDRQILIGHRVHEDDVFAHVFNTFGNNGEWTYLVLPAEARPSVTNEYFNATGWKDKREEGELLNPERFPKTVLDSKRKELRHKYECLFQQDPTPSSGDRFKPEWYRHYRQTETHYLLGNKQVPKNKAWRFATCDTAITTGSNSDYTVCQIFDCAGQDMILVDQIRKRLDGSRIVPTLANFVKSHKVQFLSVESEFIGQFVIDQLKAEQVVVRPFSAKGHGDKETRAIAAEIRLEAGRVWFPADQPWVSELQSEILAFPHGKHDDMVDALSMSCLLADKYMGTVEPELTEEQKVEVAKEKQEKRFQELLWSGTPF